MAKVLMYTTAVCPYCLMAERLLKSKGVAEIEKIRVDLEPARRQEMMQRTGRRTVPQIYVGERHRHHRHRAVAQRGVLHPAHLAVRVAHLRPLVELHQHLEGVVARDREQAVGLGRRRVVQDGRLVADGAVFGAVRGGAQEHQRCGGEALHRVSAKRPA